MSESLKTVRNGTTWANALDAKKDSVTNKE